MFDSSCPRVRLTQGDPSASGACSAMPVPLPWLAIERACGSVSDNCVFVEGTPAAFIDFDDAHPGSRIEDLGYAS